MILKLKKEHGFMRGGLRWMLFPMALAWLNSCVADDGNGTDAPKSKVTVFDNFGPDWTGHRRGGWSVAGVHGGNNWGVEQAMAFIPSAGGSLSDVWVSLSHSPRDKAKEVVFKVALDSNNLPGRILESWKLNKDFATWDEPGSPHHMAGSGRTELEAGKRYWLWATAEDSTFLAWDLLIDPKALCFHTERREGQSWLPGANETCSVFRVDVLKP